MDFILHSSMGPFWAIFDGPMPYKFINDVPRFQHASLAGINLATSQTLDIFADFNE